jgi:hypothetical protein
MIFGLGRVRVNKSPQVMHLNCQTGSSTVKPS